MTRAALRLIRAETTKRAQPAVTLPAPKRKTRPAHPARPAVPPVVAPEPETHPHGHWPLLSLRSHSQCHYPMGRDAKGRHRFCGDPSPIGPGNPDGVWCEVHRAVVFEAGSVVKPSGGN